MLLFVVKVFDLEQIRFKFRPLLHVELVISDVGFHAIL
ncbi:hypothetical protein EVA_13464 [gut metagenome]|uniref:Uncharacterized protein n=1 Tax=gut metagenome TaxID=749906 RepID=J9FTY3_9ZZZZ